MNVGQIYFQYLSPTASANCRKRKLYFVKLSDTSKSLGTVFLNEPCPSVPECGHEQDTLHLNKPWKLTFSHLGKVYG